MHFGTGTSYFQKFVLKMKPSSELVGTSEKWDPRLETFKEAQD